MARGAHFVAFGGLKAGDADDLGVGRPSPTLHEADMGGGSPWQVSQLMPGFLGGVLGIGCGIVVGVKLAGMATVAGGVEGEGGVSSGQGRGGAIAMGPRAAGGHVVPGVVANVVKRGEDLEAAATGGCEEVVDVLAAHDVGNGISAVAFRFDEGAVAFEYGLVSGCSDCQRLLVWGEAVGGIEGLHGLTVARGRPLGVEAG